MPKASYNLMLAGIGLFMTFNPAYAQRDIEQPSYEIIMARDALELRRYAPYIAAEVQVEASSVNEASSRGFRPLAGYIFGNNEGSGQIAMTAPVMTQSLPSSNLPPSSPKQIAMTAPVTTSQDNDGLYTVRFSMPSKWTMETLPIPNDENVKIIEIASEMRLAYRFIGPRNQKKMDEALEKIEAFMVAENLRALSPPIVAGYDGPSVPLDKKRWEIMRIVESD